MTVVDTHHHFLPPRYMEEVGEAEISRLLVSGNAPEWRPARSVEAMDRNGISFAILSLSSPALCTLDPTKRISLARYCNEYATSMAQDCPGRFGSFATLPLPDMEASLREIEYCADTLSCDGFCLMTNYSGQYLGDEYFAPLFEELNRRKSTIFVHPAVPAPMSAALGLPPATLEFPFDTTRTIANLLFTGSLSRYSNIRFIFSHAGGTVPFLAARLARLENQARFREQVPNGVVNELARLYFDTALSTDKFSLPGLLRLASPERVLFGSDYPHAGEAIGDRALESLRSLDLDAGLLRKIEQGNALGFLGERRRLAP
jgi:predicted TIM-barrel fold metal-dependent hydrolase